MQGMLPRIDYPTSQPPCRAGNPRQHPPLPAARHDTFTASHSRQPARVFRKLDAVTVLAARLLPAPQIVAARCLWDDVGNCAGWHWIRSQRSARLGVAFVTSALLLPPDGLLRYQSTVASRRDAWSHVALRVAFTTLASGSAWLFYLGGGGVPGLVFGMTLSALFVYLGGAGVAADLASTRRGWGREVRGSVYRDRRTFLPEKRYDLATATSAYVKNVHTSPGNYVWESSDCLYLCLSLRGRGKRKIRIARGTTFLSVVGPDQARLMLALADVLAGSPDCGATGQAVADLRMLATAPSGRVREWMGYTGQPPPGQRQFQVPPSAQRETRDAPRAPSP